jgi:hypothetical protein
MGLWLAMAGLSWPALCRPYVAIAGGGGLPGAWRAAQYTTYEPIWDLLGEG